MCTEDIACGKKREGVDKEKDIQGGRKRSSVVHRLSTRFGNKGYNHVERNHPFTNIFQKGRNAIYLPFQLDFVTSCLIKALLKGLFVKKRLKIVRSLLAGSDNYIEGIEK